MSKDLRIRTFKDFVGELTATYKRTSKPSITVQNSKSVYDFIYPYFEECMDDHEEVKIIHFNRALNVVNVHMVGSGTDSACLCDVKDVIRQMLILKVHSFCLVHNHPTGRLVASQADKDLTMKLKAAGAYFDLKMLDSMIVSRESYYSFMDEGLL
tara:strand:- start:375 stop:839 length:465 start_codon:yes stop_codon:yes gene_type:complete